MAPACVASSRLALPAVLRNVFRTQFPSYLGASSMSSYSRILTLGPLSSSGAQLRRNFGSMPRLRDSQGGFTENAAPEASTPINPTDATQPTEHKTTKNKDDEPKAAQSGGDSHNRQRKGHRKDAEARTGRSDRERKNFRNEARRELKKNPLLKAELDKANEAKQDPAKGEKKKKLEPWKVQKAALKEKFPTGWSPTKKLSPDALDGIRTLHAKAPEKFTTAVLAQEFEVSPEAIRRILKSKWRPSETEMEDRRKRWETRHDRIWSRMSELGLRPSTKSTRPVSDSHVLYDDKKPERK